MVDLLSDTYALEEGVEPQKLQSIRKHRDLLMRFNSMRARKSGTHIAQILLQVQHNSQEHKKLEAILADAFEYIGFSVERLGGSGEPDGLASAVLYSSDEAPTDDEKRPPLYKFIYDAKTTRHDSAKTGNLSLDGIQNHKNSRSVDHAMVIAPDFQDGSVSKRCENSGVTPMKASDIGKLLEHTVEFGAIPLDRMKAVFELHDPEEVSRYVNELREDLRKERTFTIDVFLKALVHLEGKVPDVLSLGTLSFICRESLGASSVEDKHVKSLIRGLSVLVPDIIGLTGSDKVIVNAPPHRVADAIRTQLDRLRESEKPHSDENEG